MTEVPFPFLHTLADRRKLAGGGSFVFYRLSPIAVLRKG
jgi:hypothetical protein